MSSNLVLVLNCGSSSLKFAIIDATTGEEKLSGLGECFNLDDARVKWKQGGEKSEAQLGAKAAHSEALKYIEEQILEQQPELLNNLIAVGHRVVHGGEKFTESVIINDDVLASIEECSTLAPLHNPAALIGINAAQQAFAKLPQIAVFDTAFHQTMDETAYLYALPYELYKEQGIRRYGFHGTSHLYVSREAAKLLNKPVDELNVITAHLGNGGSICAIKNGKSVDTSMGLTPLEGVVMGTRSGDIDPAIIFHLVNNLGYSLEEVNQILHKQSGLTGLTSGASSDFRYIRDGLESGDPACTRAHDVFVHRLAKYIASYTANLDGQLDALIFTGGIGENAADMRAEVLNKLSLLGFQVDTEKNLAARFGNEGIITKDKTTIAMVIPTNEELVIAQDSFKLVSSL